MTSNCKYCQAEINWIKVDDKNIPMNTDGTQHKCKTKETGKTGQKDPAVTLECKMANLKAFMDLTKDKPVEALPAYAGVWNSTK